MYFDISPSPGALQMVAAVATTGLLTVLSPTEAVSPDASICAPGHGENAPDPICPTTVGGGWEASYNASGLGGGAAAAQHWGIGTTGQGGVFHGQDVNTFEYSIIPNAGVTPDNGFDTYPFVSITATFTLKGLTSSDITISNVASAYGTQPEAVPNASLVTDTSVPEPGTVGMLAAGILLLGWGRRFRRPVA